MTNYVHARSEVLTPKTLHFSGSAALIAFGAIPILGTAANAAKLTRLGAIVATRLSRAIAILSRIATGVKDLIAIKKAASGGALFWKATYATYDFVLCKASGMWSSTRDSSSDLDRIVRR